MKITKLKIKNLKAVLSILLILVVLLSSIKFIFFKPKTVLADSLFTLNEGYGSSVNDNNGNVAAGTITGAVWKTSELCLNDKCLYFDGAGDRIAFADDADLDFAAADDFTITGWFRHPTIATNPDYLVAKHQSGTAGGYKIYMDADGDLVFGIDDDGTWDTTDIIGDDQSKNFDDNRWHFFAAQKDGTTGIYLYVDGNLIDQDTSLAETGTLANAASFYIGIDADGSSNSWAGFIDEVKVYRSLRTTAELNADYLAETPSRGTAASFGPNQSYLSNGLVGYWKMDETSGGASDSSGNAITLTDVNTVAFTGGKFGNAGDFESTASEYQYAADNAALSLTGSLTLAAWIKPESVTAGSYNIIAKWDGVNESYRLFQNGDEIRLELDSAGNYQETTASNLTASVWYHVAGVYDSTSQTAKIYINGVEAPSSTSGTIPSSIGDDTGRFHIGAEDSTTTTANFYDGIIDEARVYNRALSPAEIKSLYNWAAGPFAYLKFDENTGTSANDSAGNSVTGTLHATATYRPGKFGSALYLNGDATGNSSHVQLPDGAFNSLTQGTISFWFNANLTGSTWQDFLTMRDNATGQFLEFAYQTTDNTVRWWGDGCDTPLDASFTVPSPGGWHHTAVTVSSSGYKMYLDGKLMTSGSNNCFFDDLVGADAEYLEIGCYDAGTAPACIGELYEGYLDEFKVYNYPRSPSQIIEDMNAGHPIPGSPIGSATSWWKFDEGYGTTANDSGFSKSNLTLSTASWTNSGKFGKAFDGGDNKRVAGIDDSDLEPLASEDFAISAWFKSDGATTASTEYLVSKGGSGAGGYQIYFNTSGQVVCGIDDDTTSFPEDSATTTSDYYDGTWHHVVCTRDIAKDKLYLYIDGVLQAEDSDLSATGSLATSLTFYLNDQNATNGTDEFLGNIDEVRFYRLSINEDQVKLLYNQAAAAVWGANSTDSSNTPSWSNTDEYCPPGQGSSCTAPVGEWKLDENTGTTAYDTSETGNSGSFSGSPLWRPGKVGQALYFDGTDDYVSVPYSSSQDLTANLTISFWFKPQETIDSSISSHKGLLSKANTNTDANNDWVFFWNSGDGGRLRFGTYGDNIQTTTSTWTAGVWYHIQAVVTSTNTANIYVNGRLDTYNSDSDISTDPINGNQDTVINIGLSRVAAGDLYFNGLIDDIRFYNYARSPAQIAWEYNHGKPIAWYKMDESSWANDCSSDTVMDSSLNDNHGRSCPSGTGPTGGASGKFNNSGSFDGTNDYIQIPDSSELRLTSSGTISLWVNPNSLPTSGWKVLLSKGNWGGGLNNFSIYYVGSNSNLRFDLAGSTTPPNIIQISNSYTPVGSWTHIVSTWDGSTIRLYINGKQISSTTQTKTPNTTGYDLYVGTAQGSASYVFDGKIDDVRLFNYSLDANQVKLLFNENSTIRFGPALGNP